MSKQPYFRVGEVVMYIPWNSDSTYIPKKARILGINEGVTKHYGEEWNCYSIEYIGEVPKMMKRKENNILEYVFHSIPLQRLL